MSRRKSLVARQPNGQPRRQPQGPSPTEIVRLRDAALAGLRDPIWGTTLGRLYLAGKLTSSQFAAGRRWAELVKVYASACLSPRPPRSAKLERGDGMAVDPDSAVGRREARRHVQAVESYIAASEILKHAGETPRRAVTDVVERDLYPVGQFQMAALHVGLSALATLWRVK
jgi:hypothetical protein